MAVKSAAAAISNSCWIYNVILDYSQAQHELQQMQVDAPETL